MERELLDVLKSGALENCYKCLSMYSSCKLNEDQLKDFRTLLTDVVERTEIYVSSLTASKEIAARTMQADSKTFVNALKERNDIITLEIVKSLDILWNVVDMFFESSDVDEKLKMKKTKMLDKISHESSFLKPSTKFLKYKESSNFVGGIHVGIYHQNVENIVYVSIYNKCNKETSVFMIYEIGENEKIDIAVIFEEIKSELQNKKLGCCCIYLEGNYDNEYRKECIELGIAFEFQKIEFLNYYGHQYLQTVYNANYKLEENNSIWLSELDGTFIWEKVNGKAESLLWLPWDPTSKANFNKFEVAVIVHKYPSALFCHPDIQIDFESMKKVIPDTKVCICERFPNLNIPLIKARLMASDVEVKDYDFCNAMRFEANVYYNGREIMAFSEFQKLPCQKSVKVVKASDQNYFELRRGIMKNLIYLPNYHRFLLTVSFDENEIYNFTFEELPFCFIDAETEFSYLKFLNKASNELRPSKFSEKYEFLSKRLLLTDVSINATGIDFGTTSCYAAVNRMSGIETVPLDNQGQRNLASFVSYDEDNPKCGKIVVDRLRNFAHSSIYDLKQLVGKSYNNIVFDEIWPFRIIPLEDDSFAIELKKRGTIVSKYSEEIVAELFKTIKQKAEEFRGKELAQAVITFSYNFNKRQKDGIYAAALLAGWKSIHLLPEPIAAAFAYSLEHPIPNLDTVLVVDFGGGSLKICVLKIINDEIFILSYQNSYEINGKIFDKVIADHLEEKLKSDFGVIIDKNKRYKLMTESREIKEDLSFNEEAWLHLDEIDSSFDDHISITQNHFEIMTSFLLSKIKEFISNTVKETKIDRILYVGGGCKMPTVKNLLKEMFKESIHFCHPHPDEVNAIGAAYYAYYLNLSTRQMCDAGLNNTAVFDIMRFVLKNQKLIKNLLKN